MSTLIDLDAELAACVFVTSTAAKARAQLFAAIEPSHFAQQPCADFWRVAKAFEAEGTSTAWLRIVEALQASKASHPASRSWRDWFLAIRDQSAPYLARGGLTPDERAEELERDLRNAHERREIRRVCLEGAARAEEKREAGEALRIELVERLVPRTVQTRRGPGFDARRGEATPRTPILADQRGNAEPVAKRRPARPADARQPHSARGRHGRR